MPRPFAPHRSLLCARGLLGLLVIGLAALMDAGRTEAITIQFDYRYDAIGFFGTTEAPTPARLTLEQAASAYEPLADSLAAISPGGVNSWSAAFFNPSTGGSTSLPNLQIAGDTILVFAGAYDLESTSIGEAAPGIGSPSQGASMTFKDAARNRGQGSPEADWASWGGSIAFDTIESSGNPRRWHFDGNSLPGFSDYDFYSVAIHELGHLFGFGTSAAFQTNVLDGDFRGSHVLDLYGAPAPLNSDLQHWAGGVTSPPLAEGQPLPAYGRALSAGQRKALTPLDYAALADIGWEVPGVLLGLPGDVDADGDVDGSDFLDWQRGWGGSAGAPGDANGDSIVDDLDGRLVLRNFGAQDIRLITSQGAIVAEPTGVVVAILGVLALVGAGRRRA